MRSAPPPRALAPRVLVAGFSFVMLAALCGCGGGMSKRVAAEPAVRLDRPAAAPSTTATRSSGFEEEAIREADVDDDSRREQPAARGRDDAEDETNAPGEEDAPLRHVLRRGQTLYSVARMYGVEVSALMQANGIKNARHVAANRVLDIPATRSGRGASPAPKSAVVQASIVPAPGVPDDGDSPGAKNRKDAQPEADEAQQPALAWPAQGAITAAFGRRGKSDHHEGIDIDGQTGDPIRAAASGTVAFAGMHGDYGRTVVIDHGEGWRTVYAHASALSVEEGDPVRVGDTLGEVGHSGNARGSHLHFEVRHDGRAVNPIPYLRPGDTLTASVVPAPKSRSKPAKAKPAPSKQAKRAPASASQQVPSATQ